MGTIKLNRNNTLNLPVKAKWYNLIESGEKREEYREIKPYWIKRLIYLSTGIKLDEQLARSYAKCKEDLVLLLKQEYAGYKPYDNAQFSYGYTKKRMAFNIESISIGYGRPEWGAEPGKRYFVIVLGERLQ